MGRLLKFNAHKNTTIFCQFVGCKAKATAPLMLTLSNVSRRIELCAKHHNHATDRIDALQKQMQDLMDAVMVGK